MCPKTARETHVFVLVGVLGLGGVGDGGVTVGAVVFTVLEGRPRVRHDQELLDVTLQGGSTEGQGWMVLVETPARGCSQSHKHKEIKSKTRGRATFPTWARPLGRARGKPPCPGIGCSTRCEPAVLHPQPQIHLPKRQITPNSSSTTALTAPGRAGAGKLREKSSVPPKSAATRGQRNNSFAAGPVQLCRAAGSPCPVLKAPYWPQNFSSQKASRPFFYILPHLDDVPPAADTERENRNASDQPRKEPKGGFFSLKTRCRGSSSGARAG